MLVASIISTLVILVLVLRINYVMNTVGGYSEDDKWNPFETIIAMLFGWLGVVYILVKHFNDLTITPKP